MNYADELRNRRKTPTVAWHKLRTSIHTTKFDFYMVFEGEEDEAFYSAFLDERFSEMKFLPLICDGKGGVLALHDAAYEAYGSLKNIFFFVDADHDRFLGYDRYPSHVFVTCGYSIENYIYDTDVVMSGITKYFQLNPADTLCNEIRSEFENERMIFEKRTRSIMSYAVALRINNQNPDMDKIKFHTLFERDKNGIVCKKIDCASLLQETSTQSIPAKEVFERFRSLKLTEPNELFRGKLVSQFVVNFCKRLTKSFQERTKLNGKPFKAKIDFGNKNLINLFVEFVDVPDRLAEFFDEMHSMVVNP